MNTPNRTSASPMTADLPERRHSVLVNGSLLFGQTRIDHDDGSVASTGHRLFCIQQCREDGAPIGGGKVSRVRCE
jgi:hypothetical protein